MQESLASVSSFGTQLYLPKTFRNDAAAGRLARLPGSGPDALARAVCEQLVTSRWGRQLADAA